MNIQDSVAWREHQPSGLMSTLGPLLSRREADEWVYGMRVDARHLNQAGLVHGGTLTTLMDHALSTIAWQHAGKSPCLTVQLNTNFLSGAQNGQLLVARGRVTHSTGSMVFLDGSIQADGTLVATGQAIMRRLAAR
ncbi:MAG TPA: PaaI family thioesterase [Burkholderiaceae bacterium]|nr:PaaI family thioesterase [Burkholderiaceae bacterium]